MKKLYILLLLTIQIVNSQILPKRPWLFYTHIAAVNNLYPFAASDINEMKSGTNPNVNTLIFLHGLQSNTRFSKKITVTSDKTYKEEKLMVSLDSGSTTTFLNGVKWALSQAPHDFLFIDLWNHGSGILNPVTKNTRGVCFDDISSNYLTDKNLRTSFSEIVKLRKGKKIDILGFDACLMASIESHATYAEYVKYIVASEETIPGYGWGYKTVLNSLTNNIQPQNFAAAMVASYKQTYNNVEADFTLSAVDSSKIKLLAQNVNSVAQTLVNLLNEDQDFASVIKKSLNETVSYYESYYIDLGNFYQNLIKNLATSNLNIVVIKINNLINSLNSGIRLLKQCVISNVAGPSKKNSMGISIYFPTDVVDPSYTQLYWTSQYPNWLNFLYKYLAY